MALGYVQALDTRYKFLALYIVGPHLQPLKHWRAFHLAGALSTLLQLLLMLFKTFKWMHLSMEQRLTSTIAENSLNVNKLVTRFLVLLVFFGLTSALVMTNLWSETVESVFYRGVGQEVPRLLNPDCFCFPFTISNIKLMGECQKRQKKTNELLFRALTGL